MRTKIKHINQLETSDCGPACLAMILNYYGINIGLKELKTHFEFTRSGVSAYEMSEISKKMGFESLTIKIQSSQLSELPLPCILYINQNHFVVLEKITTKNNKLYLTIFDPSRGKTKVEFAVFQKSWFDKDNKGICIIFEKQKDLGLKFNNAKQKITKTETFKNLFSFVKQNKFRYIFSFILLLIATIGSWFLPKIFENIVDLGIKKNNLNIIIYFLSAQLLLSISIQISEFVSQIIITKYNFKLSINLINNIIKKLIRLPISYFDIKLKTEILNRFHDQGTIQDFFTWHLIDFIFSFVNLIVFSILLIYYNLYLFIIYFVLSIFSILWVSLFLKKRRDLEYSTFLKQSEMNNKMYEFVMNMPEVKVNNVQNNFIGAIVKDQDILNTFGLKNLFLNMYQASGMHLFNNLKEILVIGLSCYFIISSDMTFGQLLAVSFVIGQLSGPYNSILSLIKNGQDARIASERVNIIYEEDNEDKDIDEGNKLDIDGDILIKNLTFKYQGALNPILFDNLSLNIPHNKTTAIVGESGSGKTTLLKLILGFYDKYEGEIFINKQNLKNINKQDWRQKCSVVFQDGEIFSGTIAQNISLFDKIIDENKLQKIFNDTLLSDFVNSLSQKQHTKIGEEGVNVSGGQKQRILIARALYRDFDYIFLDEASSSLDVKTEKIIQNKLDSYYSNKTALIIAHRLSTVVNADNIIVIDKGKIVEQGTHQSLLGNKGVYYNLVKNQLNL